MKRLRKTIALDIKLQAKSNLYAIGIGVAALLGMVLRALVPVQQSGRGLVAFFGLGIGGTTFMFAASMLLLEKSEHTLDALRVSMLRASDYVLSKVITLVGFALLECLMVFALAHRGVDVQFVVLVLGCVVLGAMYTLLGLALVAPFRSVTRFLLPTGTLAAMIAQIPVLALVNLGADDLWWWIPSHAPLLLLRGAFEPLSSVQWAYATGVSAVSIYILYRWSLVRCARHTGLGQGEVSA